MSLKEYIDDDYNIKENVNLDELDIKIVNELTNYSFDLYDKLSDSKLKELVLYNCSVLREMDDSRIIEIFKDEEFVEQLIQQCPKFILYIRGVNITSEKYKNYIMDIFSQKITTKTVELGAIYKNISEDMQMDYELCSNLLKKNIYYFGKIKNHELKNNDKLLYQYLYQYPQNFIDYVDRLNNILDEKLLLKILENNMNNLYKLDSSNPIVKNSLDIVNLLKNKYSLNNIEELKASFIVENDFFNMGTDVIISILRYDNESKDIIDSIIKNGTTEYFNYYMELYFQSHERNIESIQRAMLTYPQVELLIKDIKDKKIVVNYDNLEKVINNNECFKITSVEELNNFDNILKSKIDETLISSTNKNEILNGLLSIICNKNLDEIKDFYDNYLSGDIIEYKKICKERNVEYSLEEFEKILEIIKKITEEENLSKCGEIIKNQDFPIINLEDIKEKICNSFSKIYNDNFIDLKAQKSRIEKGVEIIDLEGQKFSMLIHRIFNFDFNMTSLAKELLENPNRWNELEGTNNISTSYISEKKIVGVFRALQKSSNAEFIHFDNEEEKQEFIRKGVQESIDIMNGKITSKIADESVFYGFTDISKSCINKMAPTDMMVEHGKKKYGTQSSTTNFMNPDDMAYWTSQTYWNEVAVNRYSTTDNSRLQPTCIVCFDGVINDNSILAAKSFGIPIVNIDRKKYFQRNQNELFENLDLLLNTGDKKYVKDIFYTLSYEKLVNFIPLLVEEINTRNLPNSSEIYNEIISNMEHFIKYSARGSVGGEKTIKEINVRMNKYLEYLKMEVLNKGNLKEEIPLKK